MLDRERDRVAAAGRRLAAQGLVVGTAGNVSERVDDHVAISATGVVLAELSAGDVTVVNLDGQRLGGHRAPSSELQLHLGIYRRYRVGGVAHTHAPMATALSCVVDEVPVVHYEMLELGGAVRVAPYATFGTAALAAGTLDALEDRSAALMANHGAVTFGSDVDVAVDRTRLLEWACTVYWRAAMVGRPRVLDQEQLADVSEAYRTTARTRRPPRER
jgi:L-fuculose-phosphate aldolase